MKNRFLRKIIVYSASTLIVCGVIGGIIVVKSLKDKQEQKALEATYAAPKPVMTQEEMETLYDNHKREGMSEIEIQEEIVEENSSEEELVEEEVIVDVESINQELETVVENAVYEGCPVDFQGMWDVNPDVYAWITIPGTAIDYPILQHATDNSYYLNYNIDGSYGYPGCIYTENMNSKDFTDNNTVIYGHNMKNGTMFAGLHKYEDASFFEQNSKIFIYTPKKELSYTIFATYIYDDRHLLYSFNFADEAVYSTYLEDIKGMRSLNANLREDVSVTGEDKIITLVTCIANQDDKRLLVQAVLDEN